MASFQFVTLANLPTSSSPYQPYRFRGAVAIVNGSNWSLLLETVRWATISSTLAKAMPRSLPGFSMRWYGICPNIGFQWIGTFKGNQGTINYSFYAKSMEVSYRLSLQPSLGSSCRVCRFVAKHPTLISIMERKWNPQWLLLIWGFLVIGEIPKLIIEKWKSYRLLHRLSWFISWFPVWNSTKNLRKLPRSMVDLLLLYRLMSRFKAKRSA